MNAEASFFDARRHSEALALLASNHLKRGEYAAAFQYADRRCRLFKPGASDYLLRSEASRRAGYADFAAQDLALALDADPTDRTVKGLALLWGSDEAKRQVARAIVADGDGERDVLRRAIALLFENGAKTLFRLARTERRVAGWVAWPRTGALALRVEAATTQIYHIPPDPAHELGGDDWVCAEIEAPDSGGELRRLVFLLDGVETNSFSPPPKTRECWNYQRAWRTAAPGAIAKPDLLTIVVPVYEDFEATRACIEAVSVEGSRIVTKLIVVDDASPNPGLRSWLDVQAASGRFQLIRNERNLGFAVSVNKALALCPEGDVLLLNADALPPPFCLDRLVDVGCSGADIGTVTPLSNNGELTSFPKPYVANPLGPPEEVARLDALAWRANGAAAVELPNGVGFCLFITRACLDAVGPLPEIYDRGYYEDVEFCLRAREKGFRNVCAPGVYVGHAGARSFGVEKRRLVRRNLTALDRRFPASSLECAAFLHADPLQPWRSAIEALAPVQGTAALLVCAEGAAGLLAREEALRRAGSEGEPTPLICLYTRGGDRVSLRGVGDVGPHSLGFSLRDARDAAAFRAYLRAVDLARIEIFDPLTLPEPLLKTLSTLKRRIELVGADFEWVFPSPLPVGGPCGELAVSGPCGSCSVAFAPGEAERNRTDRLKRRRFLISKVKAIRPLDRMSEIFARRVFGETLVLDAPIPDSPVHASPKAISEGALAIVAPEPCALADRLTVALGRALLRRGHVKRIVVLGECVNDLAAMGSGNVFVAGRVESEEYERLLCQYEVSALMSPFRTRFFGRLDRLSRISGLPKAYFDWTFGKMPLAEGDLAIDPRVCDAKAAAQAVDWFGGDRLESGLRGSDSR